MEVLTDKIRRRYDRISRVYDILENPMERMSLKGWRIELMKELRGKVLEVGVGTGKNIQYYPDNLDITAIDFSERMLDRARLRAAKYNKKANLMLMDVQNMSFEDSTFDTVFTTCVFCSVPDPLKGFKEIKRVTRKGGRIILIEHVRSEGKVVGALMDILNPLVVSLYGANINRRTVENLKKAGFEELQVTNLWKDIVLKIVAINN
ncbi:MAG: Phosphatidylethanolamine N-methyltransferase [Firmicutes bacterium]|nr:Phosphatidylethanolamine N-methyltransferase [Bacillota bacterium]MDI6705436.1 methyltransferase domain-containing protein [Bacillota bacterium]